MMEDEKFKITIRIADIPEFGMQINRNEEIYYRRAAKEIQHLWSSWKTSSKDVDSNKIMAAMALRYAKQFYVASEQIKANEDEYNKSLEDANKFLESFEKELDNILLDINK